MRNYSTLLLLLTSLISFFSYSSNAQVKGIVTDEQNHPLAFATIYVENSTLGTTTNSDGNYELNLPKGKHTLIFQYIGYEKEKRSIELKSDKNYELNVQLKEQSVTLNELVIVANGEDPAYRIIRNAIKAKTANNIIYDSYSADVYTKGIQKILDAPVKIMGIEVGDLQGNLDTTRQGIVYLSESVSKLYFKKPDIYKEVMISSKVSGKDNGFSFNQASVLNFNFYNNHIDFQRSMLSPIADNALLYYNYRLEGSCYNENKNLIYKISVIPKLNTEPVFSGSIYIFDGSWKIHSLNLTTFAKNLQIPIIDSLNIKQVFVPHLQDDLVLFNSSISFGLNIFKFKIQGSFNAVFSNYKVDDILADSTAKYKKDLLTVLPNANKKDSTYWESIRPIPLTQEERIDYQRKDSINDVRTSKVYLDSTDKKANRFHFKDLVLGYQYNKTYKKEKFQIFSPLSTIGFNPIQGYYINLNSQYRKVFNEYYTRFYEVSNLLQYGFTDHKLRLSAKYAYNFNKIKYNRFEVETGQIVQQFNEENPVSILINPYYALFAKKNFLKLYEKSYLKSSYQQYLTDGLFAKCNVEYQTRKLLSNNTEHSFSNKDIPYEPNFTLHNNDINDTTSFETSLITTINLKYQPGTQYLSYPYKRINVGSKFPIFHAKYSRAWYLNDKSATFDFLSLKIEKDEIPIGIVGKSKLSIEYGKFINQPNSFVDYHHFNGNEMDLINRSSNLGYFLSLPYYDFSTNSSYFETHFEHNFEGFATDKIPLINKLGISTVISSNLLYTNKSFYHEYSIGFDKIGWSLFKIFTIDYVVSFIGNRQSNHGFLFGVKLN